jgi:hypothetical protein
MVSNIQRGGVSMRFKIQLVVCADEGQLDTTHDVAVLEKEGRCIEQLGLTLSEAKQLLNQLQRHMVQQQATAYLAAHTQCPACGAPLQVKEQTTRTVRTLFGVIILASPRLYHCRCQARLTTTFRPLTALLTESTTPELLFLEAKWTSLLSYGRTARVLKDFLPVDETLNATTVQNHTLAVAQRCEEELGRDQDVFVEGRPGNGGPSSRPEGPICVGLDGGYVRDWNQKHRRFEVIVGKSVPADQPTKCLGFVQSYHTRAKQRLGVAVTRRAQQSATYVLVRWR